MVNIDAIAEASRSLSCRRRATRISMPVEIELDAAGQKVSAVVRDVSSVDTLGPHVLGIGMHHNEALPLDVSIVCRLVSETEAIPKESRVTLMWTRRFGVDGFLSGGRLVRDNRNNDNEDAS